MIALPLCITLLEPLLATALEGDPNSATSYPFIPGSLIRGALIARYLGKHQLVDAAVDEHARRLFFSGATRFLNAYPLDREGRRTLPVPLAWMKEKGSEAPTRIYDWSLVGIGADPEQPKTLSEPFCRLTGDVVEVYQPLRRFSVHTLRDRHMGRATEGGGAVFRYEALAQGQAFGAAILCDHDSDLELLRPFLEAGWLNVGRSRAAGYGSIDLDATQEPHIDWREAGRAAVDIPAGRPFTLTLLSDAAVRGGDGQYLTTLTGDLLAGWLGVGSVTIRDVFKRSGVIGGFNRKWGLPLPQIPVIRAGSVFVLEVDEPITAAAIAGLEWQGIGCRRAEGLGRVAVNWHGQEEELRLVKIEPGETQEAPGDLAGESLDLARVMLRRLLDREVEGKVTDYVNTLDFRPRGIKASQLARLRVIVRSAQGDDDTKRVGDWLESLKPTARKQFEAARVRGARLMDWLKERLASPEGVWNEVGLQPHTLPAIGQEELELSEKLARRVTLRLIDGALARAIKEVKGDD
jgi:CRISPR-associated protein Csx10